MIEIPHTLAAVARPGDTILIGFARRMSDEELEGMRSDFEQFTEVTGIHIAFVEGATSMVVARPDPAPYEVDAEEISDWGGA